MVIDGYSETHLRYMLLIPKIILYILFLNTKPKLKLEVDTLMKEGKLSLHIQEIVAERCKDIPVEQCCLIMTYYKKDGRIILDAVDT